MREAETHGVHSEAASREVYPGGQISHSASLKRVPCNSIILRVSPYRRSRRRILHPRYDLQRCTACNVQLTTYALKGATSSLNKATEDVQRAEDKVWF